MKTDRIWLGLCLVCCAIFFNSSTNAQCSAHINTFPYNEGFETSMGNWFVSNISVNSDWAWGTPTKTIIDMAGGGSKCWITGGLSSSSYNNGEESFLQSPCFDISSLQNPEISFKIFWETELNYDGAGFQYSIDGGNSWTNLGTPNENNCSTSYWFNNSSIRYLSTTQGWSGNIQQGGSSDKWVTAMHSLSVVKGASNIMFRFSFGAGTRNNDYDGFAVDDIFIGEAAGGNTDYTYACRGNNEVDFTAVNNACTNTFSWNFGDAASGANNTSNLANTVHVFSSPGSYNVQLTSGGATVSKQIIVVGVSVSTKNITCNGAANGSATATLTGGSNYFYSWNTNPVQTTSSITNLAAGTYTLTAGASAACAVSQSVTVTEPATLTATVNAMPEICGNKKGSVSATPAGGTPPYTFLWGNNENGNETANLPAGNYPVTITDSNKCSVAYSNIVVADSITDLHVFLGNDTAFCPGNKLVLNPGNFATYYWQDHSSGNTFTVFTTGTYWVNVSDSNGCSASDTINVTVDCNDIFFPSAFTPNNDGRNDLYGAAGNLPAVKNYSLLIYNRWGQLIFSTKNPYQKWDGKLSGHDCTSGTYVWLASYSINSNAAETQKGTLILLR